jgi:sugar phosphate isomerase/epimerase
MRLGFYTYSYIDRLGMEPREVIPRVAAAGYDCLDLSATWHEDEDPALFPRERRREIRALADDHGLTIEAVVTHLPMLNSLQDGRPINLSGAVDLANDLGAPVVTVHVGSPSGAEASRAEWSLAVEYLQRCCQYAAQGTISIATDALFPDFLTPTPGSIRKFLDDVGGPHIGHNFDPCYLALCGFDVTEAARLLGRGIVHAHVKDYTGVYPQWEHRIPGEGVLDHREWARALRDARFDGAVAVECFTDMPLDHALEVGYRTVAAALRAEGARG